MNATIAKLQQEKHQQNPYGMNPAMMGHGYYNPMMMAQGFQNQTPHGQDGFKPKNSGYGRKRNPGKNFSFYNRYCWSCGGCDHWGRKFSVKKSGHVDNASFKNKQGGSVENCFNT